MSGRRDRPGAAGLPAPSDRAGTAALVVLAVAWGLVMQSLGWAQTSYYALVKALGDGTAQIDRYHWETRDKSYTAGHFYSVKAPGLPLLLAPVNSLLDAAGAQSLARRAADSARRGGARDWTYRGLNVASYGYDAARAAQIKRRLEVQAPQIWALGLIGSVLPALLLLVLVRGMADRIRPGTGTAAALTLGLGTLVMPFAMQLFGHLLAATLAFAAFAVLVAERRGPPRSRAVASAGLLAGLAVTTEYPLAIAGAIVGLYGLLRADVIAAGARALARRGALYAGGVLAGVAPLLAYDQWAFGSVTTTSYANAVDRQGFSGHDTLGLNSGGFFGIDLPRPHAALELLLAPRGLLALTPVVAVAAFGVVSIARRGMRAEAWTIAAIALAFFAYDSGYWLPFGGGSPGPRFLIPLLPFLALGFAESWRRLPATTLVLGIAGAVVMTTGALTYPLIGTGGLWQWWWRTRHAIFEHTLPSVFGADNGWLAVTPVLALLVLAIVLGARASGRLDVRRDLPLALAALAGWALLALELAPRIGERPVLGAGGRYGAVVHRGLSPEVVWIAVCAALIALGAALWREHPRHAPARGSAVQVEDDERPAALALQA